MKFIIPIRKSLLLIVILIPLGAVAYVLHETDFREETVSHSSKINRLSEQLGVVALPYKSSPMEISLLDLKGQLVKLSDYRGKVVFLNFWTTWCPTCVIEMPSMEKLYQRLKHKNFAMIAVNLQEPAERVEKFFNKNNLTFTSLLDTKGEISARFSIRSIPTTFILDKEGRIICKAEGPREWDSKKAIALLEHLIDEKGTRI